MSFSSRSFGVAQREHCVYELVMSLVDDVALHEARGFDHQAWRALAEVFERGVEEALRTHSRPLLQRANSSQHAREDASLSV